MRLACERQQRRLTTKLGGAIINRVELYKIFRIAIMRHLGMECSAGTAEK